MVLKPQAAIFDLDGTLLDSSSVWHEIDRAFLGKRGFAVPEDYYAAISPLGFGEGAAYTIQRFGLNETPAAVMAEWQEMSHQAFTHQVNCKPGVYAYLSHLKKRRIPCAVATASHRELFEPALRRSGIYDFFSSFTTITEVKRGKGFPDIYLLAAKRLGVPPAQCCVFEDILQGIEAAKAGGFFTVAVADSASESQRPALIQAADRYVQRLDSLIENDVFA